MIKSTPFLLVVYCLLLKLMFKNYWKANPFHPAELGIYFALLLITSFFLFETEDLPPPKQKKSHKIYATTTPQISEAFSTQIIIGKVISNQAGFIHPRREGLIQDLLVDIGDQIQKGQTIGYLFPPGVENESPLLIERAKTQFEAAKDQLIHTKKVTAQSVLLTQKKLDLAQTKLDAYTLPTHSETHQKFNQAQATATQTLQNLETLLFGPNKTPLTQDRFLHQFHDQVQATNVFTAFKNMKRFAFTDHKTLPGHLQQLERLLSKTESLYQTHIPTSLPSPLPEIQALRKNIMEQQEILEDLTQTINQHEDQKSTAQKAFSLAQSEAEAAINQANKQVQIALTSYQKALAKSGHTKIIAPFSGKIAAKHGHIGSLAHPKNPLYEVLEVPTTLGIMTPQEIIFHLPITMGNSLEIGTLVQIQNLINKKDLFLATIVRKSAQTVPQTNTITIHAVPTQARPFLHNENVFVLIQNAQNPVYSIPSSSLKKRGSKTYLFTQTKKQKATPEFETIEVQVMAEDGEYTDIVSEKLNLDSEVVVYPSVRLFREVPTMINSTP